MSTTRPARCLLVLLIGLTLLSGGVGCNVPDDMAKQVATNVANSAVNYFFQILPKDLTNLTGG